MTNKAPMINDQKRRVIPWKLALGYLLVIGIWSLAFSQSAPPAIYSNDFQSTPPGPPPEEFKITTGDFSVKEEPGNRFLEAGTSPLDSFGIQVGPEREGATTITVRIRGYTTGRRFPEFGVSLSGTGGPRLIVMPAINEIQIRQNDRTIARASFTWKDGQWVQLRAQVVQAGDGKWIFTGKAWTEGASEPSEFLVRHELPQAPSAGRAMVWAMPYSEKPIQFDDLRITDD